MIDGRKKRNNGMTEYWIWK